MTDPSISTPLGPDGVGPLLEQAVDVLAEVHAVPWERIWPSEKPRGLVEEITWWSRLLERVREPSFSASADTLLAALMSTAHRSHESGCVMETTKLIMSFTATSDSSGSSIGNWLAWDRNCSTSAGSE